MIFRECVEKPSFAEEEERVGEDGEEWRKGGRRGVLYERRENDRKSFRAQNCRQERLWDNL